MEWGKAGLRSGPWVKEADAAPLPVPLHPLHLSAIYATTRTLAATGHGSPHDRPRQAAAAAMQPTHAPGQDVGASFLSWPDNPTKLSGRTRK